ncbi:MAG TPA: F0F1 ATP synthase subunit epsilon [Flavobacterium sp.]|jgi:F-type H+-transporting ATPase subunit epsilon|uniref:F0F1 ATP synthase subunit epsilon n=1 Tax=Flavobacterium sp. TaxID=239 RepID=UPI001B40D941|nr:F0F1 ATP synthase subunit epsilon [Flavobacterium sp.]MBP8888221.1 F0F1 ATP synthase subunit epsilon [Flavobacterium sp.]HRM46539.1 F0F1 ATP synthase subunit epsilon [Flavobacterium sp.]
MILEIVSPEAKLFSAEVTSVTVPGVDGSFQILNNHAPIVSLLEKGLIKITASNFKFGKEEAKFFTKLNDENYTLAISSGTIEMKDNKVIILAD